VSEWARPSTRTASCAPNSGALSINKFHNYLSPIKYAKEITVTADSSVGTTYSSGCSELGIVSNGAFASFLGGEVTTLQQDGIVSPTEFVIFWSRTSCSRAPNRQLSATAAFSAFHTAQGSPAQTWGSWITIRAEISAPAHMTFRREPRNRRMDERPSRNNPTPAWGNIGQVSGCQDNFEVGDPLSGTLMPTSDLNGYSYHLQELASQLVLQRRRRCLLWHGWRVFRERHIQGTIEGLSSGRHLLTPGAALTFRAAVRSQEAPSLGIEGPLPWAWPP